MDTEEYSGFPRAKWNRRSGERCKLKGPLRVFRLCLLAMVVPSLLIAVPLYLRYHVYSDQLVPLGMSDMRLLDKKISTTWCQRQLISSNATFNAYLLAQKPAVQREPKFVTMVREVVLEDDMKEYWGFYLLKGSTVTVSSCCRRPGASLIIIRGHHHLRQCAYIGDDSSEEEEEAEEIRQKHEEEETKYSVPKLMQRARPDVFFHENKTAPNGEEYIIKNNLDLNDRVDEFDLSLLEEHRAMTRPDAKRVGSEENGFPSSQEVFKAVITKLKSYQSQGKNALGEAKRRLSSDKTYDSWNQLKQLLEYNSGEDSENRNHDGRVTMTFEDQKQNGGRDRRHIKLLSAVQEHLNAHDEQGNNAEEEGVEHQEVRGTINGTTANDTSNSEFWSSFSSSEERLLECDGLILSQPLIPSHKCHKSTLSQDFLKISSEQRISYTVPGNGYYFFVFSSENEIQPNYIRAHFELEKMLYNVSNPVAACENSTGDCSLPLKFFSHESLVLELPVNDSLWNTEFLVVSTCEPRTALYVACIVAVPILILLCAF